MNLKNNIESILYSIGKKISITDIASLTKEETEKVLEALEELKKDYENRESALMVIQTGEFWKLVAKEKYSNILKKIISEVELPKSIMETLAVIAWKQPVLQSDIIDLRSSTAYNHIKQLVNEGFILKDHMGRSYLLKTSEKFANYFEIESGNIRDRLEKTRARHEKKILRQQLREKQAKKKAEANIIKTPPSPDIEINKNDLENFDKKLEKISDNIKEHTKDLDALKPKAEVIEDEQNLTS